MTYSVGQKASYSKTISESDVYQFAGISGDFNPVHVNKEAAEKSRFKRRVAHGALVSSFISTVLGTRMPGEGIIYMAQNSSFLKPVYIGDTVTAICEIIEIDGRRAKIKTEVLNQIDEIVLTGEALVLLPSDD